MKPSSQSILEGWRLTISLSGRLHRGPVCGFLVFWLQIANELYVSFRVLHCNILITKWRTSV